MLGDTISSKEGSEAFKTLCKAGSQFACFGSRQTPDKELSLMRRIAAAIVLNGGVVRSGHCDGADLAFEQGATEIDPTKMVVCLPWRNYNNEVPTAEGSTVIDLGHLPLYQQSKLTEEASKHHPAWYKLTPAVRKLMARNMLIAENAVAGFCYLSRKIGGGGSGQCYRYLTSKNVPVFDLSNSSVYNTWEEIISSLGL